MRQMKKINVIYVRCSNNTQELEHQIKSCKDYCSKNGIIIDEIIEDFGVSAYSTSMNERQGLQKVLSLAYEQKINTLVIFETSRLSRNHLEGQVIIDQLNKNKVRIISLTEGEVNKTEIDELLNSIRFYTSQIESKKTSNRIKSAKRLLKQNKSYIGGSVLFGYKIVKDKFVIDESKRNIVINMFKIYKANGTKVTIEYLKKNGKIMNNPQQLMQLLKNKLYKGILYDGYVNELRIISDTLFDEVNELIKARTTTNGATVTDRTKFLCESIIFCNCGSKMYINTARSNPSSSYRKMCKCEGQKNYSTIKMDNIINTFVSQWFDRLNKEELLNKFNKSRNDELNKMIVQEEQLKSLLHSKKVALANGNAKLLDAMEKDLSLDMIQIITDSISSLKKSIEELKMQIEEVETNIANEKVLVNRDIKVSEELINFKELYYQANNEEKKLLIRSVVDMITIGNDWDNINIIWKY